MLIVALVGLFTVSVTITLLAVSLVDIANDIGSDETTLSWVITGPMLAFGVVGPAFGKAGDMWGHKKVFLLGLAGAGIFALATAFAWSAVSLIVFRTLSASFGAATGPPAMAIINRMFEAEQRVKALGYFSFVSAGRPGARRRDRRAARRGRRLAGHLPRAGPAVLHRAPRGAGAHARDRAGRAAAASTWPARCCSALGITSFLLAVNRGSAWGWTSPGVHRRLRCSALVAAPPFVVVERRAEYPLVPLSWLRRRNVTGPLASQFFANFAYMGGFILTPVLLEDGSRATPPRSSACSSSPGPWRSRSRPRPPATSRCGSASAWPAWPARP